MREYLSPYSGAKLILLEIKMKRFEKKSNQIKSANLVSNIGRPSNRVDAPFVLCLIQYENIIINIHQTTETHIHTNGLDKLIEYF